MLTGALFSEVVVAKIWPKVSGRPDGLLFTTVTILGGAVVVPQFMMIE